MDELKQKQAVYYTSKEAADIFKVTERTILNAIRAGELRAAKIGGWRITPEDINAYFNAKADKAAADAAKPHVKRAPRPRKVKPVEETPAAKAKE